MEDKLTGSSDWICAKDSICEAKLRIWTV